MQFELQNGLFNMITNSNLFFHVMINLNWISVWSVYIRWTFFKGLTRSWTCILLIISLKLFPVLETELTLHGTFAAFALVLFLFIPVVFFLLPETKVTCERESVRVYVCLIYKFIYLHIDSKFGLKHILCLKIWNLNFIQDLSLDLIQQYFRSNSVVEEDTGINARV